jgi:periplasmic protein TonB
MKIILILVFAFCFCFVHAQTETIKIQADTIKIIKTTDSAVYFNPEIQAEFLGGIQPWKRFLQKNLRYPPKAVDDNIQGTVIVQFIVDKNGEVHDVSAISGPEELRAEAVRFIKSSSKYWIYGINNGKKVNSWRQMPIDFDLNGPWHF